jgi:molecular chaperone GrpE
LEEFEIMTDKTSKIGQQTEPELNLKLEQLSVADLEAKLTASENKANENWNLALLARADLENFRRRADKDIANAHKYGLEKLVKDLLPVVDGLELSLNSLNNNTIPENFSAGIKITFDMLLKTLNKFGVEQIDPLGKEFNPELHQAMSTKEDTSVKDNIVVDVMQKGYILSGRLLRPALVIVTKNLSSS